MKFLVIVPTYNEKENIKTTILALQEVFEKVKNHEFSILVVDDSSPDGTANVVRIMQKSLKNVHLLLRNKKEGLGAAYLHAMAVAFEKYKADAIITFDADLSHDPKIITAIVKKVENGAQYVCGTRYRRGGGIPKEWGIHRKAMSMLGNLFIRLLYFGSGLSDFTSGYKLISREVYEKIKEDMQRHNGYTFAIALNLESLRAGYKPFEIPYKFIDRTKGESKMGTEYIINAFKFVIKMRILDFASTRFGKVVFAGAGGATSQLVTYGILFYPLIELKNIFGLPANFFFGEFTLYPKFLLSQLLAIEVGVITAFSINNVWTFKDKKLSGLPFIFGLLKNNIIVVGAIAIQLIMAQILAMMLGIGLVRNYTYQIIGILVGLFWNFYFYKKVIWKVVK